MIGLFGGTFDPVHSGHLEVAAHVRQVLALDQVRFIPAGSPYHRDGVVSPSSDRLAMLQLAVKACDGFSVDRQELDRDGPTYTIDTLRQLRRDNSTIPLFLMLGVDAFNGLLDWHQGLSIPDYAHIVVMRRPGVELNRSGPLSKWLDAAIAPDSERLSAPAGGLVQIDVPQIPISSTEIRERCVNQDTITQWVPETVARYIETKQLYKKP